MKQSLILLTGLFLLFSCSSEEDNPSTPATIEEQPVEQAEESASEQEEEEEGQISIFMSNDMGVDEFLKLIERENGLREWYYWSEKNEDEVQLGRKMVKGMENLFFQSKPDELYVIGGSECGFTLLVDGDILQWYEQINPECSLDDYGY